MTSKGKTSSKDKDFIFSRPGGQSVSRSEIVFYALLRGWNLTHFTLINPN